MVNSDSAKTHPFYFLNMMSKSFGIIYSLAHRVKYTLRGKFSTFIEAVGSTPNTIFCSLLFLFWSTLPNFFMVILFLYCTSNREHPLCFHTKKRLFPKSKNNMYSLVIRTTFQFTLKLLFIVFMSPSTFQFHRRWRL